MPRIRFSAVLLAMLLAPVASVYSEDSPREKQGAKSWVANPDQVEKFSARSSTNNGGRDFIYNEEKIPDYKLPEVTTAPSGERAKTADDWRTKVRPALVAAFEQHVYGKAPLGRPESMTFDVHDLDMNAMDGSAIRKQVRIQLKNGDKELSANVVIFIPKQATKPAPAFLLICNRGKENIDPTRENKVDYWPAEEIVSRGYAAIAFHNADFDPDNYDEFKDGVHGLYDPPSGRTDSSWGTLAGWAWGASRVLDYIETDPLIDENHVAVVGHSRGGKTALWAGAADERFAMVVSNNSGCGGAALSRRQYGETVGRINRAFPHWFCKKFDSYNENEADLPIDQHQLLALSAPRILYVTSADEDLWADPHGEFLSAVEASKVYTLLGEQGLGTDKMPSLDSPIQTGKVNYHIRTGGHGLTLYDWQQFMNVADKYFHPKVK